MLTRGIRGKSTRQEKKRTFIRERNCCCLASSQAPCEEESSTVYSANRLFSVWPQYLWARDRPSDVIIYEVCVVVCGIVLTEEFHNRDHAPDFEGNHRIVC